MLKKFSYKIKKKIEFVPLIFIILITASLTTYFNYKKKIDNNNYNDFINNVYLKKTLNHVINNHLEIARSGSNSAVPLAPCFTA